MPDATTAQLTVDEAVDTAHATKDKAPVKTYRHFNISASVFANEGKNGNTYYTVTLERGYKDKNENWQHSSSFLRDEIPVASHLLVQAWTYVLEQEQKAKE